MFIGRPQNGGPTKTFVHFSKARQLHQGGGPKPQTTIPSPLPGFWKNGLRYGQKCAIYNFVKAKGTSGKPAQASCISTQEKGACRDRGRQTRLARDPFHRGEKQKTGGSTSTGAGKRSAGKSWARKSTTAPGTVITRGKARRGAKKTVT